MYTSTTRITGLSGSGIDTDSMIEQLMYAESSKLYRYQRSVTWKTWQQESYREVITKLQDFQNKWLSSVGTTNSLKYSTAFASFKNSVKSSNGGESDAVTINSSSSISKYELTISQLAESDTYTGASSIGKEIKSSANTDVDAIAEKMQTDGFSFSVSLDGKSKTVEITAEEAAGLKDLSTTADKASKIEEIINGKLKETFGTENGENKVSVSLSSDGEFSVNTILGHEISVSGSGTSTESKKVIAQNAASIKITEESKFNITVDGKTYSVAIAADEDDDESTIADKINQALASATDSGGVKTDISSYLSASINGDGALVFQARESSVSISGATGSLSSVISSTELKSTSDLKNYFNVEYGTNKATGTTTLEELFEDDIWNGDSAQITINGTTIELKKDDNLSTFLQNINSSDAGVTVSYNSTSQKFTFESNESGTVNKIEFGTDENTKAVMGALGFDTDNMESQHTKTAADAILTIDGVATTRESNTIALDGMNITLNSTTAAGETITIGNETDTDAIYETIKTFVDEYNTLISDLNTRVSETRAKSDDYSYYEPLTDQEKKEMDDDEIELWEEKAKTGLLYNDSTIKSVLSKMRSSIYSSFTLTDGSKVALYNFGITTSSDYTDNGKLVIDETKLKEAINNNLSDIQAIFTGDGTVSGKGLTENLESIVKSAVGTNGSLREKAGIANTASANENTLSKEIKELNEKITLEKERLVTKEERYYSMFSTMESSITSSNSQLDALYSMLGY